MTAPARRRFLLPALLVSAVTLLYGPTLTYDFVTYDDYDLIVRNADFLGDPGNLAAAFTSHVFSERREEGVYYRPVLLLTYFADYAIWGLNPMGYHLMNVIYHMLAVLCLFVLVREFLRWQGGAPGGEKVGGREETTAFFAALIFAVHPVQTESVAWVSGRNDILLGLFIIASLACYALRTRSTGARSFMFPASVILFAAALLTKESALFFVPLYPLYDLTVRRETPATLFSGPGHVRVSMFPAVSLAYLGLRYQLFGAFIGAEKLYGQIPFDDRLLQAPGLVTTNLLFLAWPSGLSVVHPMEGLPWVGWPLVLVGVAASAGLFAVWIRTFRSAPAVSWAAAWVIAGLVPLVNVFPLAVPVMEHRLYTVAAGFAAAVACLAMKYSGPAGFRKALVPALAALCAVFAVVSWARVPVWRNSETLWLDAIDKEPESSRAYFNLAGYYFERGDLSRTIPMLEKYVALKPDDFLGYSKLRQSLFMAGRFPEAAAVCRTLIDRTPDVVGRYLEAGVLFERMGLSDSVIAVYREGLRRNPEFYQLHNRLGMWYGRMGDTARSRLEMQAADSVARSLGGTAPQ